MCKVRLWIALGLLTAWDGNAVAEMVDVKYRGPVDLSAFECTDTPRSSFVRRVCYDAEQSYMVIKLQGAYYHYCEIDEQTVAALLSADSIGRFFNAHIKGTGSDGPFDCRTHPAPSYD